MRFRYERGRDRYPAYISMDALDRWSSFSGINPVADAAFIRANPTFVANAIIPSSSSGGGGFGGGFGGGSSAGGGGAGGGF